MKSKATVFLALLALLAVAALVWTAVDASRDLTQLELITRVTCDPPRQRVLVGGRGEVRLFDNSGKTLGKLHDSGETQAFQMLSGLAVGPQGDIWTVEQTGRVRRFSADGSLIATVLDQPDLFRGPSTVLPTNDRFVLADTVAQMLSLYNFEGELLDTYDVHYPNSPFRVPGGFAVIATGSSVVEAFAVDEKLSRIATPPALTSFVRGRSLYDIGTDSNGNVYFNSCEGFTRCDLMRRPANAPAEEAERIGAERWLADYDENDPAYFFDVTADGRLLSASPTLGAVVQWKGTANTEAPSQELTWKTLRDGFSHGNLRVSLFGDEEALAWMQEGRQQRQALRKRLAFARSGLALFFTVLMLLYLGEKMLGRYGGLRTTLGHFGRIGRQVLWPDRSALLRWILPVFLVLPVALIIALFLFALDMAGNVELTVLAALTIFVTPQVLSARKLADRRQPQTALRAMELYMHSRASDAMPSTLRWQPARASFAAPVRKKWFKKGFENVLEEFDSVGGDPFEIATILEGGLFLVAYGQRRLTWYPCQLGGKPRGVIRVAECRPRPETLGKDPSLLELPGGRFVSLDPELVALLGSKPQCNAVQEICSVCGSEIYQNAQRRCAHQRPPGRWPLFLAALLPGLGHLAAGQYQRGRWLAVAAVLLISRLMYLVIPMMVGSLPFSWERFVVPGVLYAIIWTLSVLDIRRLIKNKA